MIELAMVELAPSISSADFNILGQQIHELETAGVKWPHLKEGFAEGFLKEHPWDTLIAADKGMEFRDKQKIEPDYLSYR